MDSRILFIICVHLRSSAVDNLVAKLCATWYDPVRPTRDVGGMVFRTNLCFEGSLAPKRGKQWSAELAGGHPPAIAGFETRPLTLVVGPFDLRLVDF